jgi:predicted amidophosphoribosyltransferase
MIGIKLLNGWIDFAKTEFNCPTCQKKYNDDRGIYLRCCKKNKTFDTKINCRCGQQFYMTYNYMGDAMTFIKAKKNDKN